MMDPIKNIGEEQLSWIQPKAVQQYYELRSPARFFGTLRFPKTVGSLAEAESSAGKWTFKRAGFFHTRITVRIAGEENDFASFKPNLMLTGGVLEFASGKKFIWRASNFWASRFEFFDEQNNLAAAFRSGVEEPKLKDWFKTQARLEIPPEAEEIPELPLIVLLGWYLIVVLQMDSSAGAVAAAAS